LIRHRLLEKNRLLAERNRGWFAGRGVVALNLMSSPGSGKTTLLEKTLRAISRPAAVIEGDQATDRDAARLRATGVEAVQVNTGTGCHLEADMIWHALERLTLHAGSLLFIENVGNLVCPALFDLGERARVVLFSVTEGEDKPLKYPHMFRAADLVLLTKVDLLPFVDFDERAAGEAVAMVKPDLPILRASTKAEGGLDEWMQWLEREATR
jgi:hydrogenase nickel incorporation protein HypB